MKIDNDNWVRSKLFSPFIIDFYLFIIFIKYKQKIIMNGVLVLNSTYIGIVLYAHYTHTIYIR